MGDALRRLFANARRAGRALLLPEVIPGFPDPETSLAALDLVTHLDHVLLKVPTPVDAGHPGNTNARIISAHRAALAAGFDTAHVLAELAVRRPSFLVVYRPAVSGPVEPFLDGCAHAVDGLIFVEGEANSERMFAQMGIEPPETLALSERYGVDIARIAYVDHPDGLEEAVTAAAGFVYLALGAQTGGTMAPPAQIRRAVSRVKQIKDIPVVAGFGIRSGADVRRLLDETDVDGVTVGTALFEAIGHGGLPSFAALVNELYAACQR